MTRYIAYSAALVAALALTACPASGGDDADAGNNYGGGGQDAAVSQDTGNGGGGGETDTGNGGGGDVDMGGDNNANNTNNDTNNANNTNGGDGCTDTTVYADADGDGKGDDTKSETQCLEPGEEAEGYARVGGDCNDMDPLAFEGSEGVCNDFVDDDCNGVDEACPESRPDQVTIPDWDCTGTPPDSVYAWAVFEDENEFFATGGCFVFFEGGKDVFYSTRVNLERANPCPNNRNGCTCPTTGGVTSYDQRLYAFTLSGAPEDCPEIAHTNSQGMTQPVSNQCRKYLYQLHNFDPEYSHVATTVEALERRIESFSTVEIACVRDLTFGSFPFASLLTTEIQRNPNFVKM